MPYRDREKKRENGKAWAKANANKRRRSSRRWYLRNKDRVNATSVKWKREHAERISQRHKEKTYNLSPEAFETLWEAQGGKCPICLREMARRGTESNAVCVDHDHTTDRVRGLLCRRCNMFLGMGGDALQMFERAVDYFKRTASALCPL